LIFIADDVFDVRCLFNLKLNKAPKTLSLLVCRTKELKWKPFPNKY